MRSRGLVVMLALVLATLATAGVFLYSRGVKEDARQGGDLATVVVSKVDIAANTDLNDLIRDEMFTTTDVPKDALIDDPITQVSQLRNLRNSVYIFAGEQIPLARVQGGEVPGGLLSIPEGHQAMTVALEAPRAISGALAGGDNVAIYATFNDVEITLIEGAGTGAGTSFLKSVQAAIRAAQAAQASNGSLDIPKFDTTTVLAPQVEVLRVTRPTVQGIDGEQEADQDANANLMVTLAFEPEEAQQFVFALELGQVYLSLIPPDEEGTALGPITVAQILFPER
jgi:Flp pilus assembly protein CpaB